MFRQFSISLGFLGLVAGLTPARAQLVPLGPEIRVAEAQRGSICLAVSVAPNGAFLVVWSPAQEAHTVSCQPDGAVFGLHFNPAGEPVEDEAFVIGTTPRCVGNLQIGPVSRDGAVVTWGEEIGVSGTERVDAKVVFNEGVVQDLFRSSNDEGWIKPLRSGGFVTVSWELLAGGRLRAVAQRYDESGEPWGSPIRLPEGGAIHELDVDETADGGLVFAWLHVHPRILRHTIFAQRFNAAGRPEGRPIPVSVIRGRMSTPLVTAQESGGFVVVWTAGEEEADVLAQVYGEDGAPQGSRLRVNTQRDGRQIGRAIDRADEGDFAILWDSIRRQDRGGEIVIRHFDADGQSLGRAFPLASSREGFQGCGSLETNGDGLWVAVWIGDGPQGFGIYARRLTSRLRQP
ncbi:MAG TPA: hypothetical protein VMW27_12380 [Thermoanaerobaculia bacterium]|nr:hypothetical protein [Thermoanaerobaculia bacterium]